MIRKTFISTTLTLLLSSLSLPSQAAKEEVVEASAEITNKKEKAQTGNKPDAQKAGEDEDREMPNRELQPFPEFPEPINLNGFGSDEPIERPDMPQRGIITFGPEAVQHTTMAHWEQFPWTGFKAKRSGRYLVRLTYVLNRNSLGMQFRLSDLNVKKSLRAASAPAKIYLGKTYIEKPGEIAFSMLTQTIDPTVFSIKEVALIPAPEGDEITQSQDGSITLHAKDAITWSENMRYEPKAEKNCLGYWTEPDDFAEWEFKVNKPGRYKVTVIHGCGGGNAGSEVEVKQAEQSLKFVTLETGGFQKWKEIQVGEIEIKDSGLQRLVIDPVNKKKAAVLDVQKVILTPVG